MRLPTAVATAVVLLATLMPSPATSAMVEDGARDQAIATLTADSAALFDDPYHELQWALRAMNLPYSDSPSTIRPITIAILDTGIDRDHEELVNKVITEINFTDSPTTDDLIGHGTSMAGIIAAHSHNGIGITGIVPQSILINIKVADDYGSCLANSVAQGIRWAADKGAAVINISLELRGYSIELEDAVNYAWSRGSIIIAAAGNDAGNAPIYPACIKNCIAVAAIKPNDELAPLSNYGDWVDVAAPGFEIYSAAPDNRYAYETGTSFAAAHVSGLAALLFGVLTDTNGDGRLNDEVRGAIERGCRRIATKGTGYGAIDASRSLASLQ